MWAVLGKMAFGHQFLSYVQLLYAGPTARIQAGGMLSDPFKLERGILLYLGDVGSSIKPAMAIIQAFGDWSGLRINWDKSVLLPLDPSPYTLLPTAAHLQVVSDFQYLGIKVNARPQNYIAPLLGKVVDKVDSWCRLPLTVIGRSLLR